MNLFNESVNTVVSYKPSCKKKEPLYLQHLIHYRVVFSVDDLLCIQVVGACLKMQLC